MILARLVLLMAAAVIAAHGPLDAAGDFEAAKALYASASYEEALATLNALGPEADQTQVNQYQSLCLLALGRTKEAEAPLLRLIAAHPLFVVNQGQVSPRLVDLFHEVRRRTLPSIARDLYAKAKASFDASQDQEAAAQFETLLALLKDPDVMAGSLNAADMNDLGQGFLSLSRARIAAAAAARAANAAAKAAAAPPPAASAAEPKIYTVEDTDVTPPVEIERQMPAWAPTHAMERQGTFRGRLKIVVNPRGEVTAATLVDSVFPTYNAELVELARGWRYQPATRQGAAVWYSQVLDIVLQPIS